VYFQFFQFLAQVKYLITFSFYPFNSFPFIQNLKPPLISCIINILIQPLLPFLLCCIILLILHLLLSNLFQLLDYLQKFLLFPLFAQKLLLLLIDLILKLNLLIISIPNFLLHLPLFPLISFLKLVFQFILLYQDLFTVFFLYLSAKLLKFLNLFLQFFFYCCAIDPDSDFRTCVHLLLNI